MNTIESFPIRPILGRAIVRIEVTKEVETESGIIVSLDSKTANLKRDGFDRVGVIVAFDEEFYDSPKNAARVVDGIEVDPLMKPDVKVGDRVFFQTSWSGEGWDYKGVRYHTLEGDDIAGHVGSDVRIEAVSR